MKTYQHTQSATWTLVIMAMTAIVLTVMGLTFVRPLLFLVPILILLGWLFRSLTIEITDGELRWRFGPGLIHRSVPLTQIVSARPVRTNVLEGWGIHYSRFGWLYNVSGFDAVAVTLKNGKQFALGSDEPERLVEAVEAKAT
jgi:hypothetical protein